LSVLALAGNTLPATTPDALAQVAVLQNVLLRAEQLAIRTEHVLHGGMYARTIRLAPEVVLTGALIKRATMLIVNGSTAVLVGDGWAELDGYYVIPASAGRKQVFVTRGTVEITMIFPTQAKTVEGAEAEFTDEVEMLLSRRLDGHDLVTITGE
jgi:hypothetical protein